MKKSKIKYLWILIFIMMISIIFLLSSQNNSDSHVISNGLIDWLNNINISSVFKKQILSYITEDLLIRKCAHAFLYLLLGISCYFMLKWTKLSHCYSLTLVLCFLYACSDEIHQFFVNGRTASLLDVCIDTIGAIIGVSMIWLIKRIRKTN
ncbi:MAG: VanZ family protein [Erysipelotrichaceae bacterium]